MLLGHPHASGSVRSARRGATRATRLADETATGQHDGVTNPYAIESEDGYHEQAEQLGVTREHADRVLRRATTDADETPDTNPYQLAYLQLVADLHRNPE